MVWRYVIFQSGVFLHWKGLKARWLLNFIAKYIFCHLIIDAVGELNGETMKRCHKEFLELLCTAVSVNSGYSSEIVANVKHPTGLPEQRGNRTECALLHFTTAVGHDYAKIREQYPHDEFAKLLPFNSSRKSMLSVVRIPTGWRVFCKGAAEIILQKYVVINFLQKLSWKHKLHRTTSG